MKIRHLFSRQTRDALGATPWRNVLTWGVIIGWVATAWFFPTALPWWGWVLGFVIGLVGFAFLGRYWADKDQAEREKNG